MKGTRVTKPVSSVAITPHGRNSLLASAVSGVLLASAFGAPAVAQQVQIDAKGPLEEIIVTARYRDEQLQEIPIAITAINAQEMEMRAFTTAYEVAYTVPNASFRPAQAAYGNTMTAFIRGIGQYDFDQAFEPGVGIYVDDVYQPFMLGTQLDLIGVDRVEVLRGPQGTLFGRGSIGGVVRLISKKPQGDDTGYVDATVGSYDRVDLRAGYDFGITDNLFAQVSAASRKRSGYQDVIDFACKFPEQAGFLPVRDPSRGRNCKTGTQCGEDIDAIRGQLRWVATDDVEFLLAADYQNDQSEAKADTIINIQYPLDASGNELPNSNYALYNNLYVAHVPTPEEPWGYGIPYDNRFIPDDIYETYATYNDPASGLSFRPTSAIEREAIAGTMNWELSDNVTLTAIASYTDIKSQLSSDADASPINFQVTAGQQDFDWVTGEVRLAGRAADRVDWTVGAFYYSGDATNRQAVSFPPIPFGIVAGIPGFGPAFAASCVESPPGPANPCAFFGSPLFSNVSVNTRNVADSESYAGFGHVVFDLTDQISINAGVRYSQDTKDVDFDNSLVAASINIDEDHTDWRVGIDFKVNEDVLTYASVATGYRPPAYNPRPFQASQAVAVGGEEATAYELGFKSELFDRQLRLNLAAFYTDYNERIVPIGGGDCTSGTEQDPSTPGVIPDSDGDFCFPNTFTSLTSYQQLQDGEVQGAEVELEWRPVDGLLLNGIFGWTDWSSPEVDDCDFNLDGQPDPGLVCSDRANFVPEYNWSLGAAYDFAFSNGSMLTPRVDVYGQSEICSSVVSGLSCSDGYELLNLRLQWSSPDAKWTVALGGTNVTDEEYFLNIFDLTLFQQNTVEAQPGRPAEWYVTFGRNF